MIRARGLADPDGHSPEGKSNGPSSLNRAVGVAVLGYGFRSPESIDGRENSTSDPQTFAVN
jgi:hypothetical protein